MTKPSPDIMSKQASLVVFSDDWGRHPSSCQHLMRQLRERHAITWINTIGMRTPRLDWSTIQRGLEKLGHWLWRSQTSPTDFEADRVKVLNPRMWPRFTTLWDRQLNRIMLNRQLIPALHHLPQPVVAITTIPVVADIMETLPVIRWIYYCVDDFSEWPGLDKKTMLTLEKEVVKRADVLIAVSTTLQNRLREMGRNSHLLTHGVDGEFWKSKTNQDLPETIAALEKPLALFWGVIDQRMDITFLEVLSRKMTQGSIVLVGPMANPDQSLQKIPRIHCLGPMAFSALPALAQQAQVLIMPYADAPVTRAMQPLKFKEYLATGKPTVVRDLPATREWLDCADLADNPEDFAKAVLSRMQTGLPTDQQLARNRIIHESWQAKAKQFETWALGEF